MKLEKFTAALDHLKGFDVNLYVGEEVYKGKLLGVESDHVVLETDKKYIFYYRIDKIQAITKNTKDFKTQKSNAHFKQTQSLMELLQSFQNTWVSILSIHKQRFNGVLAEVDSDFVTLINGEERILLKLDYVSNILKGFIKEEEEKADAKNEKAQTQSRNSEDKKDHNDEAASEKDKNEHKSEKREDNKSTKKEAAADKREHKSDKQANTHLTEQGKSEKKAKQENKDTEKHQHVTVVQQSNTASWSKPIKTETCEPCEADTSTGSHKDKSKSSKGNTDKKHEMNQKDKQKEEPKMDKTKEEPKKDKQKEEPKMDKAKEEPKMDKQKEEPKMDKAKEEPKIAKPKPIPPKEKDKPKQEAKHDATPPKQKDTAKAEAPQKEKHSNEMVAEKNNTSYVWKPISQAKKSSRFAGEPVTATNEKKGAVSTEPVKEKGKSEKPTKTDNVRAFPFGGEFKAPDHSRTFPFAGEPIAANDTPRAFPFAGFPNKVKKTSGFLNF